MKLLANKTKRAGKKSKERATLKKILRPIITPIVDKALREYQFLDNALNDNNCTLDTAAMAYGLLKIATSGEKPPTLIKNVMDRLYDHLRPVIEGERTGLDNESEVMPVCEWIAFLSGLGLQ